MPVPAPPNSAWIVTADQVAAMLGRLATTAAEISAADITLGLIFGYCRGAIPTPYPPDVVAVATLIACRIAPNLQQYEGRTLSVEGLAQTHSGAFKGLTLTEQLMLNRYRRRTA